MPEGIPEGTETVAKRGKKAQSAIEYFITYGWAILIIAVITAVLSVFVLLPSLLPPSSCTISYGSYCDDIVLNFNAVASSYIWLLLTNSQSYPLLAPSIKINTSSFTTTNSICRPNFVLPGGSMLCSAQLPVGAVYQGQTLSGTTYLSAISCQSGNAITCANSIRQTYSGYFTVQTSTSPANTLTISLATQNPQWQACAAGDQLAATVMLFGTPLTGATVNFTANTVTASVSPSQTSTDRSGRAYALVASSAVGNLLVTATFANVSATNTIIFTACPSTSTATTTTSTTLSISTSTTATTTTSTTSTSSTSTVYTCFSGGGLTCTETFNALSGITSDAFTCTTPTAIGPSACGSTTWTAPAGVTLINYLLVGGGAGGGGTSYGGGGGAGGFLTGWSNVNPGSSYTVTVGAGGAGGAANHGGKNGGNSIISGILYPPTAIGGGGGGTYYYYTGSSGGSGGGGGGGGGPGTPSGSGTQGQGNSGGYGYPGTKYNNPGGGGGGGAGAAGGDDVGGGPGGAGLPSSITGNQVYYAGGGGGSGAVGGSGGGGCCGNSGTDGLGGGGGQAAQGGAGTVVIAYTVPH